MARETLTQQVARLQAEIALKDEIIASLQAKLTPQSKPTDATRNIVGTINNTVSIQEQVYAFAKQHNVPHMKVVVSGNRMIIK